MNSAWLRGLGALLAILLVGAAGARLASARRESTTYEAALVDVAIPSDPSSIEEGERLFVSRGCASADCHTRDAGGSIMLPDGPFGTLVAADLTTLADSTGRDWDRAVRHGMRSDGRSLVFMPSGDFVDMPDRELGLIAAYVRSLPRVDRELPANDVGMLARVLDLAGVVVLYPASQIDHAAVSEPDAAPGRTVEHGAYLTRSCTGCHGLGLSGGAIPGAPPELGTPRNLTFHETGLARWSEADFIRAMREGRTPDGDTLDGAQMPWPELGRMTDDELGAIYLYLQTRPHVPEGNR